MSNVDILQEIDFGTITIDLEINFEYLDIKVVCFLPLVIDHNPDQYVSYPWLQIITQVINHNLGNKMLGQAGPNSITQVMIYDLGYDL